MKTWRLLGRAYRFVDEIAERGVVSINSRQVGLPSTTVPGRKLVKPAH
jgi:hypothetical protein